MTHPTDPSRPVTPTVREIAALTARLRDISARGRDVDPAERAAFLADKDALIARITETETETDTDTDSHVGDDAFGDDRLTAGWDVLEMPEWMRQQARDTEAAIAAGTVPDVYTDDAPALAARIAELRAQQAARNRFEHPPRRDVGTATNYRRSSSAARGGEPEQDRRVQLARWHADDQAAAGPDPSHIDGHGDALDRFAGGPTPQGDNP